MMIEPPIGELLEKVDCRYTLAVEASKRAREIIAGAQPLIDTKEEQQDFKLVRTCKLGPRIDIL